MHIHTPGLSCQLSALRSRNPIRHATTQSNGHDSFSQSQFLLKMYILESSTRHFKAESLNAYQYAVEDEKFKKKYPKRTEKHFLKLK